MDTLCKIFKYYIMCLDLEADKDIKYYSVIQGSFEALHTIYIGVKL